MEEREKAEAGKTSQTAAAETDYAIEKVMCYTISGFALLLICFKLLDVF